LIAVNKPEGIASIHERNQESLHSLLQKERKIKLLPVHRLDKEASGIIIFAKNESAHKYMNGLFEKRKVHKKYITLVHGLVKDNEGIINKPIRQFGSGRMGVDEENGKKSQTKYKVIKRFDSSTLLEAYPLTGRRHQIRVHLYFIGHPVVGDNSYGDILIQKEYPRLMLHANRIYFKLPDGIEIEIKSELPESFTTMNDSKQ
ncbi:MAG: RNA pseudouridine synthase, partial [Ignavibacteria bacterium RBG_13_36_8]